ncbi:TPA: lipase chaperone, partial [Aeromonas dhakensis]|nr:lipase chaperone [Aeromonas dhakensis]
MNKAWLMAALLGAALLLGGWQLWPTPSHDSAAPLA